ncbi:MAG: DUF5320 domain-containing protein [Eubacteriales bacterium]
MPRLDGTGPNGLGSMTGRGAGFCTGFINPRTGYRNRFVNRYGRFFCIAGLLSGCVYLAYRCLRENTDKS